MLSLEPGEGWNPGQGAIDLINGVNGAVTFASDPFGSTFKALKEAAAGLAKDVLPALTEATLPDLSAAWFINAYQISFATAIFVAVIILIPQFLRTARGAMAGRDLIESVGLYFGLFLVGAMFGPAFGMVLINFFHSLSNVFVAWGVQGTTDQVIVQFQSMIVAADPVGMTGGIVVAMILMLCLVIGLFLVILMLIVQLVTLYFTGVLLPLGLVWIIDSTKRSFGLKLVGLWIGILAAHPLLFFLLGFTFTMMAGSVGTFGNNLSLQSLVTFLVAIIALFMAALSPLLLMKFAPVIPMGSGGSQGPSFAGGGGNTIGSPDLTDAGKRFGKSRDNDSPSSASPSTEAQPTAAAGPSGVRGGLSEAAAARARAGAGAEGAAGAGAGGGAAAAEGGLAAAGVAESATGVGAAIGIPTLLLAGAAATAQKGVDVTKAAGDQAVAAMDEPAIGGDRP